MPRLILLAAAFASAAFASAAFASAAPLPVNGSLVAVASFDSVFPVSVERVALAMSGPPPPVPVSLPASQLAALHSSQRKLSLAQVAKQHENLRRFFAEFLPGISFDAFKAWAKPAYDEYLKNMRLTSMPLYTEQGHHRSVLLGLTIALGNVGINHFAVLDPMEAVYFTGLAASASTLRKLASQTVPTPDEAEVRRVLQALPASYDMRSVKDFPPVYDQMQCGSCWAFTSTSTLEIQNMFVNGHADVGEMSEQELVSCDTSGPDANYGCNGGVVQYAWDWIRKKGGIASAATYPYENYYKAPKSATPCSTSLESPKVLNAAGTTVYLPTAGASSSSAEILAAESAIMQYVHAGYPVTIQVAASSRCFQGYYGGVLTCECGVNSKRDPIDHVILVVGWTPTTFIARNQWSGAWGDRGYIQLPRNSAYPSMPGFGQCQMLSGPLVLSQVTQVLSSMATGQPTSPGATAQPTPQTTCASNYEYCGASSTPCCPWLCAWGQCTNNVCCSDGSCALLIKRKKRAYVVCAYRGTIETLERHG